ncbi:hypothetical protein DLK05_09420 [Ancylomarina longa]|uniref:Uncharacterized protein n=2 Tax=Ancylomarina longa TaxID=2487017 RepID=A0A434AUZ1_9BACT|nr:hypothetical protein DLK05_09420 [Ancylomarina longa]
MPFEIYIYEAERLHTRASTDIAQLRHVGMPTDLLDKLSTRIKALRRANLNWVELTNDKKLARETWKAEAPGLLNLRKSLIENMQFAYRNNADLLNILVKIKNHHTMAEFCLDLARLAALGKKNPEPLETIHFNLDLCDEAIQKSERMTELRINIDGKMYIPNNILMIRNKAFTLLKECVDEIRSYGKFVFRDNPELAKAYRSQHHRERNAKNYKDRKKNSLKNEMLTPNTKEA